ncbi:stress-response A/B barrel domain-containing protein At5g22580 [Malania oleifera]|uniref:stress-response A/B barrel domain-containing protein At5g22580 n=1 Tax=Malania oleifera TaxID=397392 RepID=UPI0025AE0745|nr:stress-response A/B barrel domain-containing protein At5g22580 [Malania oleifera]
MCLSLRLSVTLWLCVCVYLYMLGFRRLICFSAALVSVSMGEFKHLVLAKFKEGVVVEDILKGMEKLVSEIDAVKSFEWGQDMEGQEVLRQGFTHVFSMTFGSKEDYTAFVSHPHHVEFSATFSEIIEKIVLLDFPTVLVKAPAPAPAPAPASPTPPSKEP